MDFNGQSSSNSSNFISQPVGEGHLRLKSREKEEEIAKHRSHPCATASFRPRWRSANSCQMQGQEANGHFFPIDGGSINRGTQKMTVYNHYKPSFFGYPNLCNGKSNLIKWMIWGYSHFRKPPCIQ